MSGHSRLITFARVALLGALLLGLSYAGVVAGEGSETLTPNGRAIAETDRASRTGALLPDYVEKSRAVDACPHSNWAVTTAVDADWTDDIWDTTPGSYPDNNPGGVPGKCARLDGADVYLDKSIEVDGLELINGAVLRLKRPIPTDLSIKDPGAIVNQGQILVNRRNTIHVPGGQMELDVAGQYKAGTDNVLASAEMEADGVTLLPTPCGQAEEMSISQSMRVVCTGDFVMDGTDPQVVCDPGEIEPGKAIGGKTPPVLRVGTDRYSGTAKSGLELPASLRIDGSFQMLTTAVVGIRCQGTTVALRGHFDNQSTHPEWFDWPAGTLRLEGTSAQTFEVGGVDSDPPLVDPFNYGDPPHTNFFIREVQVSSKSTVTFQNLHVNTNGNTPGACEEALYVQRLVLENGGIMTLDNVRIYAAHFVGDEGNVIELGCGELVHPSGYDPPPLGNCRPIPTVSEWGLVVMTLLLAAAGSLVAARRRLRSA